MVEVIGGMENDWRDEDGVDGEVLDAEPVKLGHVPAYRWAVNISYKAQMKIGVSAMVCVH